MSALDKAYKDLVQTKKQVKSIKLKSNPVVILHEFKNEVMNFLKQLAGISLNNNYKSTVTNFPKVQQVEVAKLPKEAIKVVNEIDTTRIEKMIAEMKEMSRRDKNVLVKNQVDLSMVETLLESVVRAVEASKSSKDGSNTKTLQELSRAITELKDVVSKDREMKVSVANFDSFPVALPIASYKNSAGETKQGLVDADNHVQVDVLTAPAVTLIKDTLPVASATEAVSVAILDGSGNQITSFGGVVDANNSTTTTLGIGGTFTGTATDVKDYSGITVLVDADVTGTLHAEFSPDGTNWYNGESYTIPATTIGNAKFFTPPVQGRYYRLIYINDGTIQTRFRIHSVLKSNPVKWSSHNLTSNLHDDDDAELNVSVLKLRTAQNNYVSGTATNSGNFKVSLEETNGYEPTQYEGGEVTVGTSAVEVTFTNQTKSIMIQSDHSNTGNIWIGKSNVTSSTNRMARLMAGESVTITLNDSSDPIYAVSDIASQKVYKMAITQ